MDSERPYPWHVDNQLIGALDSFQCELEMYWKDRCDSEDEWTEINQLRREAGELAKLIRKRVMALNNSGDWNAANRIYRAYEAERRSIEEHRRAWEQKLREKFPDRQDDIDSLMKDWHSRPIDEDIDPEEESDRPLHEIWERLCIADAWEAVEGIRDRVQRLLELDRLIDRELGQVEPPDECVHFLALVSRCYVHALFPECVVMCRSAMEAAFRDSVTEEHCEQVTQPRKKDDYDYGLSVRINAAQAPVNKLLADRPDIVKEAWKIKERGDKVVHAYETSATADVLGTVGSTLRVIVALTKCK